MENQSIKLSSCEAKKTTKTNKRERGKIRPIKPIIFMMKE